MARWMGSAVVSVAALAALVLSLSLPARERLYPVVLCGFLLLFALLDLVKSLHDARTAETSGADTEAASDGRRRLLRTCCLVAAVVGYIAVWSVLGYLVSTVGFVVAVALVLGERKPWVVGALALGLGGAVYVAFGLVLQVPLPRGVLL